MTLGQLLDDVRGMYTTRLAEASRHRTADGRSVLLEAAYRLKDGSVVREGTLDLPCRTDVAVLEDGKVVETVILDVNKLVSFEPITFDWSGGLAVELRPFQWDSCRLKLRAAQALDYAPLRNWFARWFDEDDRKSPGADGLQGVVHYLSDPERSASAESVVVDLGSAPVEAFEELLDAISEMAVPSVVVGASA